MIQLSLPIQDSSWKEVGKETLDVRALILYPYYVEADANGNSFDIKKEDVQSIHDKYNNTVKFKWLKLQKLGKNIPLKYVEHAANLLDHDPKALNVVGRVVGELEIIEKGPDPYLFATIRVKGQENIERVKDGRFSQVSIGFDPITHELFEISWVVNGAIPGAQAIMSSGADQNISIKKLGRLDYTTTNLVNLKSTLFSQYEKNINKLEETENRIQIEEMLTSLEVDGKILPRDRMRIKTQLNKISDKQIRLSTFNLLSENLRTSIDYSIKSRNNIALNWEESLMKRKSTGLLDLQAIAENSAIVLKKGSKKAKFDSTSVGEEYEEKEGKMGKEEEDMSHMSKEKKMSKKDLKHCLSIHEDKDELSKYLSTFLSDEEDDEVEEEEEKEKHGEKEKGKFSKEIKSINEECAQLKKQNSDILEKIAILGKNTEESRAVFNKIVELMDTSK